MRMRRQFAVRLPFARHVETTDPAFLIKLNTRHKYVQSLSSGSTRVQGFWERTTLSERSHGHPVQSTGH